MKAIAKTLPFLLVAMISGCATPAQFENMTVEAKPGKLSMTTPLRNGLMVKEVTGGQNTNPLWTSQVGSDAFERALKKSLQSAGLLASDKDGKYDITAHLIKLDQPLVGISMTVTATVQYVVTERSTGKILYNQNINTPYTAHFGDALAGIKRLRLANEGAVRTNIRQVIDDLLKMDVKQIAVQ